MTALASDWWTVALFTALTAPACARLWGAFRGRATGSALAGGTGAVGVLFVATVLPVVMADAGWCTDRSAQALGWLGSILATAGGLLVIRLATSPHPVRDTTQEGVA